MAKSRKSKAARNTGVKHESRRGGMYRGKVCVDFDGVLHDYTLGWTGYEPKGAPIEGAIEFIKAIFDKGFEPVVFSARADSLYGENCIRDWLKKWGFPELRIFPKLNAIAYVDDRGVHCDPPMGGEADGFDFALTEIQRLADIRREYPAPLPIESKITTSGRVDWSHLEGHHPESGRYIPAGTPASPAVNKVRKGTTHIVEPLTDAELGIKGWEQGHDGVLWPIFDDGEELTRLNPLDVEATGYEFEWDDDGATVGAGRYPWDRR